MGLSKNIIVRLSGQNYSSKILVELAEEILSSNKSNLMALAVKIFAERIHELENELQKLKQGNLFGHSESSKPDGRRGV